MFASLHTHGKDLGLYAECIGIGEAKVFLFDFNGNGRGIRYCVFCYLLFCFGNGSWGLSGWGSQKLDLGLRITREQIMVISFGFDFSFRTSCHGVLPQILEISWADVGIFR